MRAHLKKSLASLLALSFVFMQIMPAQAGLVGTQAVIDQAQVELDRDRLKSALERSEVRNLLADHGVSVEQAKERIDALTDQEVSQLAADFEALPAGGVIEIIIIAALVVVILELVGIIDLFTQF
jgi:hypothetical protein